MRVGDRWRARMAVRARACRRRGVRDAAMTRHGTLPSLAAYLATFAVLALALLPRFATAVPAQPNLQDAHVLPWVLAWVAHAAAVAPSALFDANVAYPAPLQLTGTDPLLASQLVFAPLYAATGNPLLATNVLAWLCYPLGALAAQRLLVYLGASTLVAWVAGLVFALGMQRVPFNLNTLAIPNLVLPWTVLALSRLRDRPDAARAGALLLALATAVLAGLYVAMLAGILCALWGTWELGRAKPGRAAYLVRCAVVALACGILLLLVLQPYLATLGARSGAFPSGTRFGLPLGGIREVALTTFLVAGNVAQSAHLTPRTTPEIALLLVAALIAVGGWSRAVPAARALVPRGLVLWLVFALLAWGYPGPLERVVAATPVRAFRYVHRFSAIADLGLVMLLAAGLESLRAWLGRRTGTLATLCVLGVVLWSRGVPFARSPLHEVAAFTPASRAAYAAVAEIRAREGGGALLELPIRGLLPGAGTEPQTLEPDAMLASTQSWWPTPAAHLSYHAPLRAFFMRTVAALPASGALADLVDATHVRWLLLRPSEAWTSEQRADVRAALLADPAVGASWEVAPGWTLLRLDRAPQHPAWFAAARHGPAPGRSVLGSPLERIPDAAARATVRVDGALPPIVSGAGTSLAIEVRNDGDRPWAVVPTPVTPLTLDGRLPNVVRREGTVMLHERWWRAGDAPQTPPALERRIPLRRDLDPGESDRLTIEVTAPVQPGDYVLELGVEQIGGARFDGADVERRRVVVAPSSP